ncbi:hypothetical protein Avbf_11313, partial [Armadillidium vulgare]
FKANCLIVPRRMILIIGASEVAKFDQIRDYVREELEEELTIDSYPGRPLESCNRANYAINRHFHLSGRDRRARRERGWIPPHTRFMQSQSLSLNLYIMPDGLHGTVDFMRNFVLTYRRMFQDSLRENNRNPQPRIQGPYESEHMNPSASIPSREEASYGQPSEIPSNSIILQTVPWVSSFAIGSDREEETEHDNLSDPSVSRQRSSLPILLREGSSQNVAVNEPSQGLRQSFLQEGTLDLSPIVQRAIEEGVDNLVTSSVNINSDFSTTIPNSKLIKFQLEGDLKITRSPKLGSSPSR